MTGACRLNNKLMRNIRKDTTYQAMAVDLAMLGVISKEECETLLGSGIPKGLTLPDGSQGNLISESDLPKQPIKTEPEPEPEPTDTEPTDTEPTDTEPTDTDSEE